MGGILEMLSCLYLAALATFSYFGGDGKLLFETFQPTIRPYRTVLSRTMMETTTLHEVHSLKLHYEWYHISYLYR